MINLINNDPINEYLSNTLKSYSSDVYELSFIKIRLI